MRLDSGRQQDVVGVEKYHIVAVARRKAVAEGCGLAGVAVLADDFNFRKLSR